MRAPRSAALLATAAVAIGVAGCGGGSSSVSARAYVRAVCSAVGPFEQKVAARSDALNPQSIKSPLQGKSALQGFLGAIAGDTGTALSKLRAAGTPNVSHGAKIASTIVAAFVQLNTAMTAAAKKADALPTDSPAAFQAGANTLGTTVRNSMNGIGASLSELRSPALQQAAVKETACSRLAKAA